jgi:catechol 2,3-dioxygenase-like lactoylglutathione lyase family enzyme
MELTIENMIREFERGAMNRRQLALAITALFAGARKSSAAPEMEAVELNHVTVKVPDLHRTSQFYQEVFGMPLKQHSDNTHILGVGKCFFGIEQKPGPAGLDHYDFGISGFDADKVRAKLRARKLSIDPGNSKESFKFHDPDGFLVQLNAPGYEGHVG